MNATLQGPPLPPPEFSTLNEALARAATGSSGVGVLDANEHQEHRSWAEIRQAARRVAAALLERGVVPGDRVALVLPTDHDFLAAFFGALLAGATPVPLYPPVRLARLDEYAQATGRMLALVGARVVLTQRRVNLLLGPALERTPPPLGCATVAELASRRNEAEQRVEPEALGLIQFSSGSTVEPKPVALTHRALLAQCAALKALLPLPADSTETGVSWLPLYHDMGLIGCLLLAAYWPASLVLIPPELFLARPALWLKALSRSRATISPAPNFAYGLCLKRVRDEELAGVDLSHWRYALNGAEPVSASLMERFSERFGRYGFKADSLMPVYGLSEAALAVTFTSGTGPKRTLDVDPQALARDGLVAPGSRRLVSVGTPVPGVELVIRRGAEVAATGQVGRIVIRGPSLMREYFGQREATAAALVDGWLDTGDLGFVDDGELFVCGRAKDLVIIRGANHPPQQFEECLDGLKGVRLGCAVAMGFVPPGGEEESLLLLVETTPEAPDDLRERLVAEVLLHTGIKPHTVALLAPGTLPRTSSGKLRRGEALRRYLAGGLVAPRPVTPLGLGREVARSALAHARRALARRTS
jgi:acyl-CoA synthetase (AMP-forming)/AMP-acid ligase II